MQIYDIDCEKKVNTILKYFYDNRDKICERKFNFSIDRENKYKLHCGLYTYNDIENNITLCISYKEEGTPLSVNGKPQYLKKLKLETGENIMIKFMKIIQDLEKVNIEKTIKIFTVDDYGEWSLYHEISSRKLESIYIDEAIKQNIVDDIKHFISYEDEYNNFGIPYKRSYLLSGYPGNGKTSLIKSIVSHFKYSLSILTLTKKFSDDSLKYCFSSLKENTIVLIEDIDSFFNDRKSNDNSITFSNLINILDGVLTKSGLIIFMTTNHPEKLDQALLRIGRVDMIFDIGYPSKKNIQRFFYDIMKTENKDDFTDFYNNINDKKLSMSQIVNFLFKYRENWNKNMNELLDANAFINKKNIQSNNLYN